MEDLNKQQVILLAILVSIVTSIATGITTVSLVAQAPGQTVTQTINRIVEKTVERVVEGEAPEPETIIIEREPEKEIVTVVVNEDDKIVEAIAQNSQSLMRIHEKRRSNDYVALGVVLRSDGITYVPAQFYNAGRTYFGKYKGVEFDLDLVYRDPAQRFVLLQPQKTPSVSFSAIRIGSTNDLAIGESVVALSGATNLVVTKGIISSLNTKTGVVNSETEGDIAEPIVTLINTSVDPSKVITGSILINSRGDTIGIKTGREGSQGAFSASSSLIDATLNMPEIESSEDFVAEKDLVIS